MLLTLNPQRVHYFVTIMLTEEQNSQQEVSLLANKKIITVKKIILYTLQNVSTR